MKLCCDCGNKCTGKRCKECFLKKVKKKFVFGKFEISGAKELNNTIKIMIQESPRNEEFRNEFFKELINTYHEGVKKANLKVIKFKILDYHHQVNEWEFARDRYRGGIFVIGFFEPIQKWHGVTLYPHKKTSVKQSLILALRQKWSESAERREPNARCESCGNYKPQLHHDNISFQSIAQECLKEFTEDELKYGLGIDWWLHESEADAIRDNHPSVMKLFELHNEVKYKWLCEECHRNV